MCMALINYAKENILIFFIFYEYQSYYSHIWIGLRQFVFKDLNINFPLKEEKGCTENYLKENNISNKNLLFELYQ